MVVAVVAAAYLVGRQDSLGEDNLAGDNLGEGNQVRPRGSLVEGRLAGGSLVEDSLDMHHRVLAEACRVWEDSPRAVEGNRVVEGSLLEVLEGGMPHTHLVGLEEDMHYCREAGWQEERY